MQNLKLCPACGYTGDGSKPLGVTKIEMLEDGSLRPTLRCGCCGCEWSWSWTGTDFLLTLIAMPQYSPYVSWLLSGNSGLRGTGQDDRS